MKMHDSSPVRPFVRDAVMTSRRWIACTLSSAMVAATCLGVTGCSELEAETDPRRTSGGATQRRLVSVPTDVAFDAGIAALKQYDFRNIRSSRTSGRIESGMSEYVQKGGTGRLRDTALQFKNRMRHKATIWVSGSGADTIVRCQVHVQRLDTADYRVFQSQGQFADVPNETPIDGDAGVSPGQNQEWTDMPRNRELEGKLINVLVNQARTVTGQT